MVNGGGDVWVEREGRLRLVTRVDDDTTRHLVERVLAPLGLRVDRVQPMADARLADGSRVNVVIPPLAIDGPCLTIRRFAADALELDAFCASEVSGLLRWAVDARQNVVVSGATGAGKTSLLGALGAMIDPTERVVTVEVGPPGDRKWLVLGVTAQSITLLHSLAGVPEVVPGESSRQP